jgi:sugar (pentulose or hexulose) kinase
VPVLGDGERDDPALRGTVTGLSLRHGRAAWARATMEGVAFGMRALLEVLGRGREPAAELRVSGRAAGLRTWNQIKADVLGVPVLRVPGDATAAGVAMLAGIGAGVYSGPGEAVAAACHPAEPVPPDPASAGRDDAVYQRYREVLASGLARVRTPGAEG